jgi:hypothetical protein
VWWGERMVAAGRMGKETAGRVDDVFPGGGAVDGDLGSCAVDDSGGMSADAVASEPLWRAGRRALKAQIVTVQLRQRLPGWSGSARRARTAGTSSVSAAESEWK